MSESIQAKRERRNALAKETRNLLDSNTGPGKWGEEQQKQYDANVAEIERIDEEIAREQKLLDLQAEREFSELGVREREEIEGNPNRALFNKWLRGGDKALNADEWQTIRNTMSTTTDAEGGYLVPEEWARTLIDALKEYGGMRAVSTVIQTSTGVQMNFPTSDGTSEVGELVAENTAATDADPSFGTKALNVYKYSSKVITVPFELLQDSAVDVEAFVRARINTRLGRITNQHFTTGTGTGQPMGIVTASTVGKTGTTGQTTTVIYDDLVDLEHSVDPAYRARGARWMMHDSSLKVIRKIKDTSGRPIFVPNYDAGIARGAPAELLGYPITINQDVPVMAANAKSILFGDFKDYVIRDVMQITLFRFTDSAYAKKGQVGFLAWMRSGGNYVQVGAGVKHYANSAT